MSYNKLKSLVANVEAIKTALQIHIQGRQATPEEKETLSQYSGFGGIKEVLNIGTDKPVSGDMEEPIRRLQELIDTYPYFTEAMKASVLTAFYTPKFLIDVVAKQIHATFKDNELQMRSFLEPSADAAERSHQTTVGEIFPRYGLHRPGFFELCLDVNILYLWDTLTVIELLYSPHSIFRL